MDASLRLICGKEVPRTGTLDTGFICQRELTPSMVTEAHRSLPRQRAKLSVWAAQTVQVRA